MRSRAHPWWGDYRYQKEIASEQGNSLYIFRSPERINGKRWWDNPDSITAMLDKEFLDFCNVEFFAELEGNHTPLAGSPNHFKTGWMDIGKKNPRLA